MPAAWAACPAEGDLSERQLDTIVSVAFAGPRTMRRINRESRGIDRMTDVLSFPMIEASQGRIIQSIEACDLVLEQPGQPAVMLGDLVISLDQAFEQAIDLGHSAEREVAFLIVHGLLHLAGYDHMNPTDETVMLAMQKKIMSKLGMKRG